MSIKQNQDNETLTQIKETLRLLSGCLEDLPEQVVVNEWSNLKRFLL